MNAIITGATGFIGSYLCKKLLDAGGHVLAIVRRNSLNSDRLVQHDRLHIIEGDLSDLEGILELIIETNIPIHVFYHLAWHGVGNKDRNSLNQLVNIEYSINTLQLAKRLNCTKWVSTGSQAEYGPLDRMITENDLPNPTTVYGAAKLATCNFSSVIGKQLDISTIWVRVFSTYGPGDNSGWMLTDVANSIMKRIRPKLTLGHQVWDYLYVEDAAEALLRLGQSNKSDGIYNLGSGKADKIRSYVEIVRDLIDPDFELVFGEVPYREDQVMHLEADISKLKADTGWVPSVNFRTGIKQTIDYIRKIQ